MSVGQSGCVGGSLSRAASRCRGRRVLVCAIALGGCFLTDSAPRPNRLRDCRPPRPRSNATRTFNIIPRMSPCGSPSSISIAANTDVAQRYFRDAVEKAPKDASAWIGLAASYDHLARFDLADQAYSQAVRLVGETTALLNNRGYSYLLRGNLVAARKDFLKAYAREPNNPIIRNNLRLLDGSKRYIVRSPDTEPPDLTKGFGRALGMVWPSFESLLRGFLPDRILETIELVSGQSRAPTDRVEPCRCCSDPSALPSPRTRHRDCRWPRRFRPAIRGRSARTRLREFLVHH